MRPGDGPSEGTALRLFRGLFRSYDRVVDCATFYQDRYWKRWAAERALDDGGGAVLDLGCGTLIFEERFGGRGHRFVGLDLTMEMLKMGKSKGLDVGQIVNGDAESLPFAEKAFDAVVCFYVPKYVGVSALSAELARVTREGGNVVLYDFARPRGPLAPLLNFYIQGVLRTLGVALGKLKRGEGVTFSVLPSIIERTTWDDEVTDAMERSGFETLEKRRLTGGAVFAYHGRKSEGRL